MRELAFALACALGASACGYRSASSPAADPLGPFDVAPSHTLTPDAVAISAALAGARAELARTGELCSSDGARATVIVEVIRVEETSAGVALEPPPGLPLAQRPMARGVDVAVTGRAFVRRSTGGSPSGSLRTTGDLTVSEVYAREPDPVLSTAGRDEAARRAATRLGERLIRRLLGRP